CAMPMGARLPIWRPPIRRFPRRAGTQYCIQYFSSWLDPADTPSHVANVANVYAAMRPYLPGAAYVNYCDLDLQNFAGAIGVQTCLGCPPSRRLMTLITCFITPKAFRSLRNCRQDVISARTGGCNSIN